jgi:peroxiredoxin
VAEQLELPADWRLPHRIAADAGRRPKLDSLGPLLWHPPVAPSWSLPDADGHKNSLRDYRGRPVIAIFFLGHGCSHCIQQLQAFAPLTGDFDRAGISLVAISTDPVGALKTNFTDAGAVPFPVLSDAGLQAFKAFRAYDDFEKLPLHGTFLIDGGGRMRWMDISFEPFLNARFLLEESKRLLKWPGQPAATRLAAQRN